MCSAFSIRYWLDYFYVTAAPHIDLYCRPYESFVSPLCENNNNQIKNTGISKVNVATLDSTC